MKIPPQSDNSYIFDPESAVEMARLIDQDRLITSGMGGLFPQDTEPSSIQRVLDLACGPGGWAREVAFAYPEAEVVGVDISKQMVEYARALARVQWLENVRFEVMDVTKPLDYSDNTFDFVNVRALVGFMPKDAWPALIQECKRVLRPGGVLRLTESDDMGSTNSASLEQLAQQGILALERVGKTFSPPGTRSLGIMRMLGPFLRQAGFVNIERAAHVIDFSAGEDAHMGMYHDIMVAYGQLQPFLKKMNIMTDETFEPLYQMALAEMMSDDFCGLWSYLSVWGEKPEESASEA